MTPAAMNVAAAPAVTPVDVAIAYHERTKHGLKRYAAGPETLDWDMQPDPFRTFAGCMRTELPLLADGLETPFSALATPGAVPPAPLTLGAVATLLELSMGLSAWKELGPDRWAVRCNPSSGNLHPTEAYVLAVHVPALANGLYHYVSRDHALELRCLSADAGADAPAGLWIGLSSIQWREAWKYGERAFRYCQLDTGHALAAFRYAAAALGWRVRLVEDLDSAGLAALLGLDRAADFAGAEREEPELLLAVDVAPGEGVTVPLPTLLAEGWVGAANVLDRHPMYRWPVIDEVARATVRRGASVARAPMVLPTYPPRRSDATGRVVEIIRGRRSAQRFDAKYHMPQATFWSLLDALLLRPQAVPFDVWDVPPSLHPVLFVHKVEGVDTGVYALPRAPEMEAPLRAALRDDFEWTKPEGCPAHLPLYRLARTDSRGVIRTLSCHQAIAGDSCFSVGFIAAFGTALEEGAWRYRQLFWEAGLLGQVLYLEATAAGLGGTGIGCYFDDDLHRLLGLEGRVFQSMYHFTVGRPMTDARIVSSPAYPDRTA
ncbi:MULTISPECIES: SagB/ThcOx family dehydrogenase [unclassified Xanthobacter]|uniref:SagB/ThcOx family dehydrogenase n=1 Tax=unclassified Xanthobacter TaxID=2623496 RepID=UPI001EDFF120|nr:MULTISPECIES: SagB/ThcOx family dehydrogenase [unclassified Xanthobacter]